MASYAAYGGNANSGRQANAENGWGSYKWPGGVPGHLLGTARYGDVALTVRNELVELVTLLLEATETRHGYNLYGPHEKPPAGWCWGYSNRAIAGTNTASNHSKGRAVDLNAPNNPYTSPLRCDIPPGAVNMWERAGFYWGGRYSGSKDAMHFEYCWTPAQVAGHIGYVRDVLGQGGQAVAPAPTPPAAPQAPSGGGGGAPGFPLPAGHYYGPYEGPNESISGRGKNDGPYKAGLATAQNRLNLHLGGAGQAHISTDGVYGPKTAGATRWYQTARHGAPFHLTVDGLIGPNTWHSLWQ